MQDFIELITTLAFILIFIIPFFRGKKKKNDQSGAPASQPADRIGSESTGPMQALEAILNGVLEDDTRAPQRQKKRKDKKRTQEKQHVAVARQPAPVIPPEQEPEPVKQGVGKLHPILTSAGSLKHAILLKEILGKPKGLE